MLALIDKQDKKMYNIFVRNCRQRTKKNEDNTYI